MELVDKKITLGWWEELLADQNRMNKWLQKLQVTEIDGYSGNFLTNAIWNQTGDRKVETFLVQTARDELRHSQLLKEVLAGRGLMPLDDQTSTSIYWDYMELKADSLEKQLAVFYLGEKLASERFEVIADHRKTPVDVSYFIDAALPDEQMHARGYQILAGEEAIEEMRFHHEEVMKIILGDRLK